jgi:uncharacterized protein YidB (DUF937 family)
MSRRSFTSLASARSVPALKRTALATGAALMLAGAVVGAAGAQQPPGATTTPSPAATSQATTTPSPAASGQATPPSRGQRAQALGEQFLNSVAAKLGVSVDRLRQAMTEARSELGLPENRPGRGHGRFAARAAVSLDAAATAIGISPAQLRQELPGKSLADVATAHGVDPNRVAEALKAEAGRRIDEAVAAGRLTAERGEELKSTAAERIDELMTRPTPAEGVGRERRRVPPGTPAAPGTPQPAVTPGP